MDRNGAFDEEAWARTLLTWEHDTRARGVNDLLGPSTKRAIEQLVRGVPASETGRFGVTDGAAMRMGAAVTYGGTLGTGMFAGIVARHLVAENIAVAVSDRKSVV